MASTINTSGIDATKPAAGAATTQAVRDNIAEIKTQFGNAITDINALQSGKSDTGHVHAAGDLTSGTLADARVAQSNVTQHQGALSLAASQVGLGNVDNKSSATIAQEQNATNITSTSDLDTLSDGWYAWTSSLPTNAPAQYMVLVQQSDASQKIQMAWGNSGSGRVYVRRADNGTFYAWTRMFADNYHPNADALTTARNIALGGDLSGNANFDGSGNITITATVADDSHNHVISNVDGLQAALDGKSATGHTHAAGDLTSGTLANARVAQGNVTQHQGALSITESQISDLGSYAVVGHAHAAGDLTSGTLADARVAQSNVTQHQGALSLTKSQVGLGNVTNEAQMPLTGGTFSGQAVFGYTAGDCAVFNDHIKFNSNAMVIRTPDGSTSYFRVYDDYNNRNLMEWRNNGYVLSNVELRSSADVVAYYSDERLKKNIQPITDSLDKIKRLRGVTFDFRDDVEGFDPAYASDTGVIAQEVQAVMPDAVKPAPFNSDYLTVQKDKLVALLIEGIKDQQAQIDELKIAVGR